MDKNETLPDTGQLSMAKGLFITFEGGEGVGKTTQIKRLETALKQKGHDVVTTREPGGTPAAEEIRNLLSHKDYGGDWTPEAELLLLFAARAMHIRDVIAPALSNNKIVLCDRYIDSTRVYQGHIQNIDKGFIQSLESKIVGRYMPDLTFIMDLPPEEAVNRVNSRGAEDHYDRADLAFYQQLHQGFLKIAQDNTNRCAIIDASRTEEDIAAEIENAVLKRLG